MLISMCSWLLNSYTVNILVGQQHENRSNLDLPVLHWHWHPSWPGGMMRTVALLVFLLAVMVLAQCLDSLP